MAEQPNAMTCPPISDEDWAKIAHYLVACGFAADEAHLLADAPTMALRDECERVGLCWPDYTRKEVLETLAALTDLSFATVERTWKSAKGRPNAQFRKLLAALSYLFYLRLRKDGTVSSSAGNNPVWILEGLYSHSTEPGWTFARSYDEARHEAMLQLQLEMAARMCTSAKARAAYIVRENAVTMDRDFHELATFAAMRLMTDEARATLYEVAISLLRSGGTCQRDPEHGMADRLESSIKAYQSARSLSDREGALADLDDLVDMVGERREVPTQYDIQESPDVVEVDDAISGLTDRVSACSSVEEAQKVWEEIEPELKRLQKRLVDVGRAHKAQVDGKLLGDQAAFPPDYRDGKRPRAPFDIGEGYGTPEPRRLY